MAEAEIREAVRGVVFARRREGQQAAAGARDRNKRGIEDGHAENQDGHEPGDGEVDRSGRTFRPSVAIRKPRNIAPPSPMKIFAGLKFQRRKPSAAPKVATPRVRTSSLAVHAGGNCEERGGHGRDAGAKAVHVVENAERGGDADDPDDGEADVEDSANGAGKKCREKLRANAGGDQK